MISDKFLKNTGGICMRILIVEDEYPLADAISETLKKENFNVDIVTDGIDEENEALTGIYELILLDIMLPKLDGLSVCKRIKNSFNVPIIMLTAKDGEIDKILGLELGADDYITKPFSVRELIARVKANLRKVEVVSNNSINNMQKEEKKKEKEKGNETLKQLMQATSSHEALELMRKHTREELSKVLEYAEQNFELTVTSFLHENLRGLRRAMGSTKFEKQLIKQMKRTGTVAMCKLDNHTVLEKGLYYYQGNDFASELVYSISRLCEPCLEHIDNNFNPLDAIQKGEFGDVAEDITYLIQQCRQKLEGNNYSNLEEDLHRANDLNSQLSHLKRQELQRIQSQTGSIKVSMVYLTMIQEAQNVVTYTINLMKVSRKFQIETDI